MHLDQGQRIGVVADLDESAYPGHCQSEGRVDDSSRTPIRNVDIRVKGRPDIELAGRIETIIPAGQEQAAFSRTGVCRRWFDTNRPGGSHRETGGGAIFRDTGCTVHPGNHDRFVPAKPWPSDSKHLPSRFSLQGWRSLLQLFQKRFRGLAWRVWPAPHGECFHSARNAKNRPAGWMRYGIRPSVLAGRL